MNSLTEAYQRGIEACYAEKVGSVNFPKTAALYHGSPEKIDKLEPRNYHGDPKVPAAVFASPSREFALAYSGGKWGDRDIEQGTHSETDDFSDARIDLREMHPGAFEETFQRPGYMYELPAESFTASPRHGTPWEQVSSTAVIPERVRKIKNVARALQAAKNIRMLPYDEEESRRLMLSDRRIKRLMELSPADREDYLSWYAEKTPPALMPDLEKLRERVSVAKTAALATRPRAELFARKDGKILSGLFPQQGIGVYGGGVDPGEDPAEAARREFLEEAGYNVENVRPIDVPAFRQRWLKAHSSPKQLRRKEEFPGGTLTRAYVGDIVGDKQGLGEDHSSWLKDVQFRPVDELLDIQRGSLNVGTPPERRLRDYRLQVLEALKMMDEKRT